MNHRKPDEGDRMKNRNELLVLIELFRSLPQQYDSSTEVREAAQSAISYIEAT